MIVSQHKLIFLNLIPPSESITRELNGSKIYTSLSREIMHSENLITLLFPLKICICIFSTTEFRDTQLDSSNAIRIIPIVATTMMSSIMTSTSTAITMLSKTLMVSKRVVIIIIFPIFRSTMNFLFIIKVNMTTMSAFSSSTPIIVTNTPTTTMTSEIIMKSIPKT